MGMYWAIVKNIHNSDKINWELSGQMWAKKFRDALEEARDYTLIINEGIPEHWTPRSDPYYVAVPVYHGDAVYRFARRSGAKADKFRALKGKMITKQPTLLETMNRLPQTEALGRVRR